MARRKNYSFERSERDRQKAAKKTAKREAKAAARAAKDGGNPANPEDAETEGVETEAASDEG